MGYTTEFTGKYKLDGYVDLELVEYINDFSSTRRMKRDVKKIVDIFPNWANMCYRGILGKEGEFFVNDVTNWGQTPDDSISDYNRPPRTQPGLWCKWTIDEMFTHEKKEYCLAWDGGEKFYDYVEWLQYLIDNFFSKEQIKLNGITLAVGEGKNDATYILVLDNKIFTFDAMEIGVIGKISKLIYSKVEVKEIFDEIQKYPEEIYNEYWNWDESY